MHRGTYDSEVLKGTSLLDVLQSGSEILELEINSLLGGLGVLDGLNLEGVNGLELAADVVGGGLEGVEALLNLVDDGLVLERRSVGGKVDRRRLLGQLLNLAASVFVSLLEGLEGGDCLTAKAQRAGNLYPVDLESCASLFRGKE